jgi:hypothetical protein
MQRFWDDKDNSAELDELFSENDGAKS